MKHHDDEQITGQRLVADFQSVLLNHATAQAAVQEAERSETELMQQLTAASRGTFLNPGALEQVGSDYVVRASLDAHIKKVQAEQLKSMSNAQIRQIITDDEHAYKGRKVRITNLDMANQPFDAVWADRQTGFRTSPYKKQSVEGEIAEIVFEKNLLVIKPKRLLRLINGDLQYFLAYPIEPASFRPAVDIVLL